MGAKWESGLRPTHTSQRPLINHASGLISTARLYCSRSLHLPPIHVVVSNGPLYRNTHLGAGFALRCFQRLSKPHVATQPYHRHDN